MRLCRTGDDTADCSARVSPWAVPADHPLSCLNAFRSSALPVADWLRVIPPRAWLAAPLDVVVRVAPPAAPLRLCRRLSPGLPRFSRPFGGADSPTSGLPRFRPLGIADDPSSGCPVVRIFRLRLVALLRVAPKRTFRFCQWPDRRVSPDRVPLVSPSGELPGCPVSSVPLAAPTTHFQVALKLGCAALASGLRLRVAPARLPFGSRSMPLRVTPLVHRRWVDDESRLSSNFASSAYTVDESSRPTGPASSARLSKLSLVSPGPAVAACTVTALS